MRAWIHSAQRAFLAAGLLTFTHSAASQGTSSITIVDRDRIAHVVGERSGVEVALDLGAWPLLPAPGGTIRIGDPARPESDCIITLPAQPPLGCLWGEQTPGEYQLIATYSGDATYAPLTSAPVSHTVLPPGQPERVSLPDQAILDRNAMSPSRRAVASADGRWIAYLSADARLTDDPLRVASDQALLFDRRTGRTRRMSSAPDGTPANQGVTAVAISGDGRFVAFQSTANNLAAGDTWGTQDWFMANRDNGQVQLLPALRPPSAETDSRSIALSFNGRYVAFASRRSDLVAGDTNDTDDVFRLDRDGGSLALVSRTPAGAVGAGLSSSPSISADGHLVAFDSFAPDLIPGDTNGRTDAFVRDLQAGTTERVSLAAGNGQVTADAFAPAISASGRFVVFVGSDGFVAGDGDRRTDIFVRDRVASTTTWVSPDPPARTLGYVFAATISSDGSRVAFRGLDSGLYLFTADTQSISMLGVDAYSLSADPPASLQITADGRTAVYDSGQGGLVADDHNRVADVFLQDLADGSTHRVSGTRLTGAGSAPAFGPVALSDDGAVVAFSSFAGNLVPSDINGGVDVFVRDRLTKRTQRASRTSGDGISFGGAGVDTVAISGDGRFVAFSSTAQDLAPGDFGNNSDVFLHDRQDGSLRLLSRRSNGQSSSGSWRPAISRDGQWVAFDSFDNFLTNPPVSGSLNVYLHDTQSGTTMVVPPSAEGFPGDVATDPRLSGDGRYVVFVSTSNALVQNDTNGVADVFLYDRVANTTRRVSVSVTGAEANGPSSDPEISADGQRIAFVSMANNLVPGDSNARHDVFVVTLPGGLIVRANVGPGGSQSTGDEFPTRAPALSADGRYLAFESRATDLVPGAGPTIDVYVRDLTLRATRRAVSRPPASQDFGAASGAISGDGRTIALMGAGGLAAGGARHSHDIFVVDNPFPAGLLFLDGFEDP